MFVTAGVWVMVIRQTDCVAGTADTVGQDDTNFRAQQSGTRVIDILCHRLF